MQYIMQVFDHYEINYTFEKEEGFQVITVPFSIPCGPALQIKFFSSEEDHDVTIAVFNVVSEIPKKMRHKALEAINKFNMEVPGFKLILDDGGDIDVQAELPWTLEESCTGDIAFEMYIRITHCLRAKYKDLIAVLYQGNKKTDSFSKINWHPVTEEGRSKESFCYISDEGLVRIDKIPPRDDQQNNGEE